MEIRRLQLICAIATGQERSCDEAGSSTWTPNRPSLVSLSQPGRMYNLLTVQTVGNNRNISTFPFGNSLSWNWQCCLGSVMKSILSCDWPRASPAALHCTLSLCIQARSYMFACTSLSSSQQHLVICSLKINTVVMCGSLFILSRRSVSSKLNQFCHSVDTSLGLSHCVVHIRRGLLGLWTLLQFATSECSLLLGTALSSAYLTSIFTDGVWHGGPFCWLAGTDGSGVKWSETGKGRGQKGKNRVQGRKMEVEEG